MIKTINRDDIVFVLANPIPEIMFEDAIERGQELFCSNIKVELKINLLYFHKIIMSSAHFILNRNYLILFINNNL